jgi:subtilisin family serine protease
MKICKLLILLLLLPILLNAQKNLLNFELQAEIERAPAEKIIHLAAFGNTTAIIESVKSLNGIVLAQAKGVVSFRLPVGAIGEFAQTSGVEFIEFSTGGAMPLNDLMVENSRITPLHLAENGLDRPLTGKDVIVGIIDTGIELQHPDFWHEDGSTRVMAIWDHLATTPQGQSPQPYDYGVEWTQQQINDGISTHQDQPVYFGHGSTVSGTLCGNGSAIGNFKGAAPDADIVVVSANFSGSNFDMTIVDAIQYIFHIADTAGKPCVINLSLGNYRGSRDGLDAAALLIDSMITAQPGRVVVCAAGNSGNWPAYHLSYEVTADTAFTWFNYQAPSVLGVGAVFFELWADTADFQQVQFAMGADKHSPSFNYRGATPFRQINDALNVVFTDTLKNGPNRLAVVQYAAFLRGGQYLLQVALPLPDSSQYRFRFITTGSGIFDIWSTSILSTSNMVSAIPSAAVFPDIVNYRLPDNLKQTVSSWTCSSKVLTVGNYSNRNFYIDFNGNTQNSPQPQGEISVNSSRGPTRDGRLKPDLSASGDRTLSTAKLSSLAQLLATEPFKVAQGGMHYRNGGTSMASPVVSGIAALLLEMCPQASAETIFNAIVENLYQDDFTGTEPGIQYGNGKADANLAMLSLFFKPEFNQTLYLPLCAGDEVDLTTLNNYVSYEWSSGESTSAINLSETGTYSLKVMNELGCNGFSDTLTLEIVPLPEVEVWPVFDTLYTAFAGNWTYQWLQSSVPVDGANSHFFKPSQSGSYSVLVTDDLGCSSESEEFDFVITALDEMSEISSWNVFPVPFGDELIISGEKAIDAVHIWSAEGRLLYTNELAFGQTDVLKINTSGWSSGLYVLSLRSGNSLEMLKVICR